MEDTGEKNWGLIALMTILAVAVLTMAFFTFKWGGLPPTGDTASSAPAVSGAPSRPNFSMVPPPPVVTPPSSSTPGLVQ